MATQELISVLERCKDRVAETELKYDIEQALKYAERTTPIKIVFGMWNDYEREGRTNMPDERELKAIFDLLDMLEDEN